MAETPPNEGRTNPRRVREVRWGPRGGPTPHPKGVQRGPREGAEMPDPDLLAK